MKLNKHILYKNLTYAHIHINIEIIMKETYTNFNFRQACPKLLSKPSHLTGKTVWSLVWILFNDSWKNVYAVS